MCAKPLSTINRSLAQARMGSCFTTVLVLLGGLHTGVMGTLSDSGRSSSVLDQHARSQNLVSVTLTGTKHKEAETNTKIVDLVNHTIDETKNCRNEQQRVGFHITLDCVMPVWETQGTNKGWITRICDRLDLRE